MDSVEQAEAVAGHWAGVAETMTCKFGCTTFFCLEIMHAASLTGSSFMTGRTTLCLQLTCDIWC